MLRIWMTYEPAMAKWGFKDERGGGACDPDELRLVLEVVIGADHMEQGSEVGGKRSLCGSSEDSSSGCAWSPGLQPRDQQDCSQEMHGMDVLNEHG